MQIKAHYKAQQQIAIQFYSCCFELRTQRNFDDHYSVLEYIYSNTMFLQSQEEFGRYDCPTAGEEID